MCNLSGLCVKYTMFVWFEQLMLKLRHPLPCCLIKRVTVRIEYIDSFNL